MNSVLLPPFLTEAVGLYSKTSAAELLNIFAAKIVEFRSEAAVNTPKSTGKYKYELGEDNKKQTRRKAERPQRIKR